MLRFDELPSSTGDTCASLDESPFRYDVRNILDISWNVRDDAILAELRRLKESEREREARRNARGGTW